MCAHLVLALKVNDNVFHGEASLLTKAGQHVFNELAVTCGSLGGAAIGKVDAAVTTFQPGPTPTLITLLWRTGAGFPILD